MMPLMVEIAIMMGQKQPKCQFLCDKGKKPKAMYCILFSEDLLVFCILEKKKRHSFPRPTQNTLFSHVPRGKEVSLTKGAARI